MTQPHPRLLSPPPVLPDELTAEILHRLPVKALLQFRCVCKSWKTLISNPQFAKDHLRISITNTSLTHQRLVYFTNDHYGCIKMETCSVPSLFENPTTPEKTLGIWVQPYSQFIVGSCYGLICLCDHDGYLRLWNPCTRLESKKSPPADLKPFRLQGGVVNRHRGRGVLVERFAHYGFGYDRVNDRYKVLIADSQHGTLIETKVHTFGTDSWTTIQNSPCALTSQVGKFASGALNWLARKGDGSIKSLIISFDLEKETYGKVLLPPHVDGDVLDVLSSGLCLCEFNGVHCGLWLMKEYGIQESWTKLASIPYGGCIIPYSFHPLCISENGVVLGSVNLQLVMYNPDSETFDYPKINKSLRQDIFIYHGSLVSPRKSH